MIGRKLALTFTLAAAAVGLGAGFSSAAQAAPKLDLKGRWAPQVLRPERTASTSCGSATTATTTPAALSPSPSSCRRG